MIRIIVGRRYNLEDVSVRDLEKDDILLSLSEKIMRIENIELKEGYCVIDGMSNGKKQCEFYMDGTTACKLTEKRPYEEEIERKKWKIKQYQDDIRKLERLNGVKPMK